MKAGEAFGCGQCLPCRIKKAREKTHRIMLESALYESSTFLTLTYSNEHLPKDGVSHEHFDNFLKRLRFHASPIRLRFYGAAEYGDTTGRAHYHFVLFGLPPTKFTEALVQKSWDYGFYEFSELNIKRARYIAKYVIKKLTELNDERLCGLNPEFNGQSRIPGLGYGMVPALAAVIEKYDLYDENGDIPFVLQHGRNKMPLDRYMRHHIRLLLSGVSAEMAALPRTAHLRRARLLRSVRVPKHRDDKREIEMQIVRYLARTDKENPSQLHHLKKISENEIAHVERRFRHYNQKGTI